MAEDGPNRGLLEPDRKANSRETRKIHHIHTIIGNLFTLISPNILKDSKGQKCSQRRGVEFDDRPDGKPIGVAARLAILLEGETIAGGNWANLLTGSSFMLAAGAAGILYFPSGSCPVSVTSAEIEPSETRNSKASPTRVWLVLRINSGPDGAFRVAIA